MIDRKFVKVTPRDQKVLDLLVQGCGNKEIARPTEHQRTVKQLLRTLFLRAGIGERRKPRETDCHVQQRGGAVMSPRERLTPKENPNRHPGVGRHDQPRNHRSTELQGDKGKGLSVPL